MSNRSFGSIFMVASCAGAALGCYLVSLRVASERTALEDVETKIVLAQRDIRLLQTEIGTRGRLAQLERWNVKVLALSAPSADQFLKGGFELAKLTTPETKPAMEAPVVLASAPAASASQPEQGKSVAPADMLHQASLKTRKPAPPAELELPLRKQAQVKAEPAPKTSVVAKPVQVQQATTKPSAKPTSTKAQPAAKQTAAKPTASKNAATKPLRSAARDPLAPLPEKKVKVAAAGKAPTVKGSTKKP